MATLLTDLTRVAKYIQDESLRKTLIDKDKDKASESGGIGTPATRDTIIKALFDRKFLTEKGKHLVSTETGRTFYDALPDKAKFPDMTALWHQEQERIEQGEQSVAAFIADLCTYIGEEVELLKKEGLPGLSAHLPKCPECQRPMRCIKGKKGFFWGCSGFQEGCKKTLPDKKGEPDFTEKPKPSQKHTCKACGKGLIRREAKSKGRFFWGCSAYPECKQLYFDCDGKPNYETPPPIAPSTSS